MRELRVMRGFAGIVSLAAAKNAHAAIFHTLAETIPANTRITRKPDRGDSIALHPDRSDLNGQ